MILDKSLYSDPLISHWSGPISGGKSSTGGITSLRIEVAMTIGVGDVLGKWVLLVHRVEYEVWIACSVGSRGLVVRLEHVR